MKKLLVAVSAISTFAINTTVSADMGSWVAKKPSSATAAQAAPASQIEQAPQAQSANGSNTAQAGVDTQVQTLPSHPQPAPGQTRPQGQIAPGGYNQQQPHQQGQATQPPQKQPTNQNQQQQQNNQVAQETANQERIARALQSAMPNAVSVLNTPSLNNSQKNYGFSYIAAVSQMISDPKNMNVSSIQQTYNTAVTCAARVGAGNTIAQMQSILLSDQAILENFKIAQSRGNFVALGQQAPGVTCS